MLKKLIELIKKILMFPIKLLKKINEAFKNLILKIFKKKKKRNKSTLEELEEYINLAKKNKLLIDCQVNFENVLIVNLTNAESLARRVRVKQKEKEV